MVTRSTFLSVTRLELPQMCEHFVFQPYCSPIEDVLLEAYRSRHASVKPVNRRDQLLTVCNILLYLDHVPQAPVLLSQSSFKQRAIKVCLLDESLNAWRRSWLWQALSCLIVVRPFLKECLQFGLWQGTIARHKNIYGLHTLKNTH